MKEKVGYASNLAVTFAQADNKVILIDADMRKGRQYTIFGASPRPGLSNYLSGMDVEDGQEPDVTDYLQKTDIENLLIMTAGNIPPNPSELLVSPQMDKLLEDLKQACDIIIIDGTPCELVTDSVILSRIVDSTLIVTASKQTKKEDLKRIIANIQQVGGTIAGVVVNKIPMNAKKYEQSYYYGSTSMSRTKNNNRTAQRSASRTTTKRQNREMYNRASNLMAQSGNRKISSKQEIADIKQNQDMEANSKTYEQTDEIPTALQNKIKIENKEEISTEKTQEILNQINQYLDEEKKKMN